MSEIKSGFGNRHAKWLLHIANRPDLAEFADDNFRMLAIGEAKSVIENTSNHWRKVFSIMAKISFALFDTGCESWQQYRDTKLLTAEGFEAISYLPYQSGEHSSLAIVAGFQYASEQLADSQLVAHHKYNKLKRVIAEPCFVTPYFDWRQLNNELLAQLINMMAVQLEQVEAYK